MSAAAKRAAEVLREYADMIAESETVLAIGHPMQGKIDDPKIQAEVDEYRELADQLDAYRWIPVCERLPKDDRPVAVLAKELEDNAAIANYCAPFWMVQASAADDDITVTHWCDCIPTPKVPA